MGMGELPPLWTWSQGGGEGSPSLTRPQDNRGFAAVDTDLWTSGRGRRRGRGHGDSGVVSDVVVGRWQGVAGVDKAAGQQWDGRYGSGQKDTGEGPPPWTRPRDQGGRADTVDVVAGRWGGLVAVN